MLGSLRRFANTWPARILLVLLVGSFALWGVTDVVRNGLGGGIDDNTVATVGAERIGPQELQDASRRMLGQLMQRTGSTAAPTPEMRRGVAEQALDRLIVGAAFAGEVARLGIVVPEDALRQATYDTRAFQGPNGQFDRMTFSTILRNNNMTEARYLQLLRTDLGQRQVVEAVRAGGTSPTMVTRLVFTWQNETRTADLVTLPFAAAAQPPEPTPAQLERQYDDNADLYRAPEYRRIKAVVLSPEGLAKDITVSDADARAFYDSHKSEWSSAATRSVQAIVASTEAAARTLAASWSAGADWDAMQKQAAASGASAIALDDQTVAAFPSPALAGPVFAASPGAVTGPVAADGGWAVFKVTKDVPGGEQPFDSVVAAVKARAALDQATDQVYDRANKVQDMLAGGAKLDELGGMGLLAVTGTLDTQGTTPDGEPAPIPGSPGLRQAIIAKAFAQAANDPPTLEDGPDHAFYAVQVESVTAPAQRPFAAVEDRVKDDWTRDARRHEQDLAATALLTAVEGGTPLKDAAAKAGLPVTRTPPVGRSNPPAGVPAELVRPLFATDAGHATMVETPTGFVVATTVAIDKPDPASDVAGLDRMRLALAGADSDDLEITFAAALRERDHVVVNRKLFDSIAQ